jgi:hypothetical protein
MAITRNIKENRYIPDMISGKKNKETRKGGKGMDFLFRFSPVLWPPTSQRITGGLDLAATLD